MQKKNLKKFDTNSQLLKKKTLSKVGREENFLNWINSKILKAFLWDREQDKDVSVTTI